MRYAQGNPQRVSDVLDIVRRIEFALHPHSRSLVKEGPTLWEALTAGAPPVEPPEPGSTEWVVELLRAMPRLDALADELAAWAQDRTGPPPADPADPVVAEVGARRAEPGGPHDRT